MHQFELDDELWALVQPHLPKPKARRARYAGRRPLEDRALLAGILYVLKTGIRWQLLPQELGCGSGMSCWRRLRAWQRSDAWEQVQMVLRNELAEGDRIDWERVADDQSTARMRTNTGNRVRTSSDHYSARAC